MGTTKSIVDGLNSIRSNVWSIILIGAGIALVLKGHPQEGGSLITGAFAVFRSSRDEGDSGIIPTVQVNAQQKDPTK